MQQQQSNLGSNRLSAEPSEGVQSGQAPVSSSHPHTSSAGSAEAGNEPCRTSLGSEGAAAIVAGQPSGALQNFRCSTSATEQLSAAGGLCAAKRGGDELPGPLLAAAACAEAAATYQGVGTGMPDAAADVCTGAVPPSDHDAAHQPPPPAASAAAAAAAAVSHNPLSPGLSSGQQLTAVASSIMAAVTALSGKLLAGFADVKQQQVKCSEQLQELQSSFAEQGRQLDGFHTSYEQQLSTLKQQVQAQDIQLQSLATSAAANKTAVEQLAAAQLTAAQLGGQLQEFGQGVHQELIWHGNELLTCMQPRQEQLQTGIERGFDMVQGGCRQPGTH